MSLGLKGPLHCLTHDWLDSDLNHAGMNQMNTLANGGSRMSKRQYANSNSQLAGRKTWVRPFVLRTTLVLLLTSVVSLPSSAADAQISRKVLFGGITYSGPYDFSELNSFEAAARKRSTLISYYQAFPMPPPSTRLWLRR